MKIYLVCNAGMSTSILVQKMKESAKKVGVEAEIEAFSVEVLEERVEDANVVMVGPQIRHMMAEIKAIINGRCPVEVIDMRDYGMVNGEAVLTKALALLK